MDMSKARLVHKPDGLTPIQKSYAAQLAGELQKQPDVMLLLDGHHGSKKTQFALYSKATIDQLKAAGYSSIAMEFPKESAQVVKAYHDTRIAHESGKMDYSELLKARAAFVKQMMLQNAVYTDPDTVGMLPNSVIKPTSEQATYLSVAAINYNKPSSFPPINPNITKKPNFDKSVQYIEKLPPDIRSEFIANVMRDAYRKADNFVAFYDHAMQSKMNFVLGDGRSDDPTISTFDDRHFLQIASQAQNQNGARNKIAFIVGAAHFATKSPYGLDTLLKKQGHSIGSLAVFHDKDAIAKYYAQFKGIKVIAKTTDGYAIEYKGIDVPNSTIEMTAGRDFSKEILTKTYDLHADTDGPESKVSSLKRNLVA